ncbi:alpha/beta hydrolase [Aquisalimonas sp. 2447]|uniref:alpha/beta hydrolase n=1 Tax=Aquisalimonas sp. 2447 TaxID=2740807 RepID=UPI0020C5ACCA|nr:alpha/beta hydrolase [Aquisalimonas sp. 2447]
MPSRYLLLPGAGLLMALAACAVHEGKPKQSTELPRTDVQDVLVEQYTPQDWPQPLDARIRQPVGEGPFPAVLVVHGGGWQRRSPDDMEGIAEQLAARGLVTVNVAYRFAPEHWFPAQLHDIQQAMHWMLDNAERLNVDAERIGALGYSSGAHLVSLMALVAGQGGELDGGPQTRPAAVVAGGTPSDLRKWEDGELLEDFLGGSRAEVPELYAAASPVVHVHQQAPPFFLFHGTMDRLVPTDHATDFHAALKEAGVSSELYLQRLRGHLLAFVLRGGAMDEATRFLHQEL